MVTAEICACLMRPASTIIHPPVCSVGLIVNSIPFFTLNLSIVLMLVVQTATVFFELQTSILFNISAVLTTILVTNKGARAHVAKRLRQQIDSFTIGGNNTVHPALVEIALVPLRSLTGSAPTLLATSTSSAGPALVRFSNPLPRASSKSLSRASGLENLTRPAPTKATLCPVHE